MKRRSYGHRRLTSELREFLNTERRMFVPPLLLVGFLALVARFAPDALLPPVFRGFMLGAVSVGYVALVLFVFTARTGALPRTLGVLAESFTHELFSTSPCAWSVVSNVEFDHYDVDHVAVTPAGVLAIETKWVGHAPTARARPGHDDWAAAAVRQSEQSGHRIRLLLRSRDFAIDVPVIPVLVLWGPGADRPSLASGWTRAGDVLVLRGPAAAPHLERFATGPLAQDTAGHVTTTLLAFVRRRAAFERMRGRRRRLGAAARSAP